MLGVVLYCRSWRNENLAKVLGLGGIFFKSPNPKALCQWYAQWLGVNLETGSDFTFALFFPHTIPKNGYTVWSAFPSSSSYFLPSDNKFMFNLVVDNLEEALGQVKAGNAQVVGNIEITDYGQFGWFTDP